MLEAFDSRGNRVYLSEKTLGHAMGVQGTPTVEDFLKAVEEQHLGSQISTVRLTHTHPPIDKTDSARFSFSDKRYSMKVMRRLAASGLAHVSVEMNLIYPKLNFFMEVTGIGKKSYILLPKAGAAAP